MHIGQTIRHRYRIDQVIGQGSMGTTYKAFDLETRQPVAVKLLHFSRVQEWKALEMFEREAKILQQLDHPRIPSYIDYFSSGTSPDIQFVLVQEYIEGKTLQFLVEHGWRGTETEILDIFMQLVNILAYLHTLHPPVIHRDINPKNILISMLNEVYLVDFGAVQERIRTTFLGGSTIVGTYGYVPFEQFSGHTTPASDYYALGATLLYMLSHRHPADFPSEDMKPDFKDSVQTSSRIIRLLDGLLDHSAKQRIASPDQVRKILEGASAGQSKGSTSPRQQKINKPSWTKIEKVVKKERVSFRIPKKLMKLLPGQAVLDLMPQEVKFRDAYKIGKNVGHSWSVPTAALRPTDVIWHFEREKPVLGINYRSRTWIVHASLAVVEVEWLVQEIREYLAASYLERLPETTRQQIQQRTETAYFQLAIPAKPPETRIETVQNRENQLAFQIRKRLLSPHSIPGTWLRKDILDFLSLLLGKRMIELSPAWIQVSNVFLGIKLGKTYHIPTSAIRPSDINCYFRRLSSEREAGSGPHRLVVGINHAGRTIDIGTNLTQEEAEWLVHEMSQYVAGYAIPTFEGRHGAGLEMR